MAGFASLIGASLAAVWSPVKRESSDAPMRCKTQSYLSVRSLCRFLVTLFPPSQPLTPLSRSLRYTHSLQRYRVRSFAKYLCTYTLCINSSSGLPLRANLAQAQARSYRRKLLSGDRVVSSTCMAYSWLRS